MKLVDVDLPAGTRAIQAEVDFTYDPSRSGERKWNSIVSLKKTDQESSFVFRASDTENCFQLYFGDGKSVKGNLRIPATGFRGKRCRLTCIRTPDVTFVRLWSGDRKVVGFAAHQGAVTCRVPPEHYEEGRPEHGITVHSSRFRNVDADDLSLAAVERELAVDLDRGGSRLSANSWLGLAMAYFWKREYSRSLALVKRAYHLDPSKINFVAFAQARTCIATLYPRKEKSTVWRKFSSPNDVIFGRARDAVLGGDIEEAVQRFDDGVERVFGAPPYRYSELHQQRIRDAFSQIVSGIEGRPPSKLPEVKTVRKAIVSGMGWSGSGAVYDYLQEFGSIDAIPDESPYIEGPSSLQSIYLSLGDDRKFKQQVVDFFFCALIGHGYFRNDNDFKLFKSARSRLSSREHERYLASIEGWCALAAATCAARGQTRRDGFSALAEYTINHFSIGREVPEGKTALLDNVVHIANAEACVHFLRSTTLFCVFRDPRSNYVSLVREAKSFNQSADAYVQQRRNRLSRCMDAATAAASLARRYGDREVVILGFEEFVLSERVRNALAARLGLDRESQNRFTHFKPWESMRNVVLHQEHPDQEGIRLIEQELREYCVEPAVRPLNIESQE